MSKHILITGASRGIGREAALYLADYGHQITAIARSNDLLSSLAEQSPYITAFPADLTDSKAIQQIIASLDEQDRDIDGLVNGAGALVNKPFGKLTESDWDQMINVNLKAPVTLIQKALPLFSENSHIVNLSSMAGYQGSSKFPGLTAYSVAKGGLTILTECLSAELSDSSISCNALCLGMVQTEMLEEAFPGVSAPVSAAEMGEYVGRFTLEGHTLYNGQILPVARQDPE